MYARLVEHRIKESLSDTPVVLVTGPRRVGKTTLVKKLEGAHRPYITLDDQAALDTAQDDPVGFIRALDTAIIDEVQRVPELLLAIKKSVDDDYRPGRFLLTGSANVMTLPKVIDSLAGRIEMIQMLPLARVEIEGVVPTFLENVFHGRFDSRRGDVVGDDLLQLVLLGGYPEAIIREKETRRQNWVHSYLTSMLSRDLIDISTVQNMTELPNFVRILAEHSGQLANYSKLGSAIGVNYKTGQRYVTLLEQLYLIATLQPWYTSSLKRIVKTPKLHFLDSCLLAAVRGLNLEKLRKHRSEFGALLESFVYSEIRKLMTGSELQISAYHFRDQQLHEVDMVLERNDGKIAGIEIKASATVRSRDFSALRILAKSCQRQFAYGVVLYDGTNIVRISEKLAAVPISSLWA